MLKVLMLGIAMLSVPPAARAQGVTYHDLAAMVPWTVGNAKIRGAMGQSGSLLIAQPPGALGAAANAGRNAHHHAQEQIMVGIDGSTISVIGGGPYRLGSYGAVVTPSNSSHYYINGTVASASTFIEFQPALRVDWFPPHPAYMAPQSAAPVAVSHDERIFENMTPSSDGWRVETTGARSKMLSGDTIRLTMWDLTAPGAAIDLDRDKQSEQFVFVMEGQAEMTVDSQRREIRAETLAVLSSAANDVRVRSLGKGSTVVAVFESIAR